MKIYLDDKRSAPDGWVRTYWPQEVIELLKGGQVVEVSLDHDLGNDKRGTGYDVILWIEHAVAEGRMTNPPEIHVHSANTPARARMDAGIEAIRRMAGQEATRGEGNPPGNGNVASDRQKGPSRPRT